MYVGVCECCCEGGLICACVCNSDKPMTVPDKKLSVPIYITRPSWPLTMRRVPSDDVSACFSEIRVPCGGAAVDDAAAVAVVRCGCVLSAVVVGSLCDDGSMNAAVAATLLLPDARRPVLTAAEAVALCSVLLDVA